MPPRTCATMIPIKIIAIAMGVFRNTFFGRGWKLDHAPFMITGDMKTKLGKEGFVKDPQTRHSAVLLPVCLGARC